MNLNTLVRHDVFVARLSESGADGSERRPTLPDNTMIDYVAGRIADVDAIRRSRQFRYQFLAAYLNAEDEVPQKIKSA